MRAVTLAFALAFAAACEPAAAPADDTTIPDDTGAPDVACDPAAAVIEGRNDADGPTLFELSDFELRDEDGDGAWRPGERLHITGWMHNVSGADDMGYPSAMLRADRDDVVVEGEAQFYGIFADDSLELQFAAVAGEDLAAGAVVRFTAVVGRLGCYEGDACPHPSPVCFEVEVGSE